ncbi:unnamed protein product [Polarella glacialis]|uniref:Uncharacterized protein n=1 Tax=Polarella glacialis TaxID=89957 RepID=A0A813I604_POLGL|nr:unnamed protein product [Polarella glacialis]
MNLQPAVVASASSQLASAMSFGSVAGSRSAWTFPAPGAPVAVAGAPGARPDATGAVTSIAAVPGTAGVISGPMRLAMPLPGVAGSAQLPVSQRGSAYPAQSPSLIATATTAGAPSAFEHECQRRRQRFPELSSPRHHFRAVEPLSLAKVSPSLSSGSPTPLSTGFFAASSGSVARSAVTSAPGQRPGPAQNGSSSPFHFQWPGPGPGLPLANVTAGPRPCQSSSPPSSKVYAAPAVGASGLPTFYRLEPATASTASAAAAASTASPSPPSSAAAQVATPSPGAGAVGEADIAEESANVVLPASGTAPFPSSPRHATREPLAAIPGVSSTLSTQMAASATAVPSGGAPTPAADPIPSGQNPGAALSRGPRGLPIRFRAGQGQDDASLSPERTQTVAAAEAQSPAVPLTATSSGSDCAPPPPEPTPSLEKPRSPCLTSPRYKAAQAALERGLQQAWNRQGVRHKQGEHYLRISALSRETWDVDTKSPFVFKRGVEADPKSGTKPILLASSNLFSPLADSFSQKLSVRGNDSSGLSAAARAAALCGSLRRDSGATQATGSPSTPRTSVGSTRTPRTSLTSLRGEPSPRSQTFRRESGSSLGVRAADSPSRGAASPRRSGASRCEADSGGPSLGSIGGRSSTEGRSSTGGRSSRGSVGRRESNPGGLACRPGSVSPRDLVPQSRSPLRSEIRQLKPKSTADALGMSKRSLDHVIRSLPGASRGDGKDEGGRLWWSSSVISSSASLVQPGCDSAEGDSGGPGFGSLQPSSQESSRDVLSQENDARMVPQRRSRELSPSLTRTNGTQTVRNKRPV